MLHRRNGEIIPESIENSSIFHDRNEPHFRRYVEEGLGLECNASDENIAHAMELQGKITGVISAQPHEWATLVALRQLQAQEDQAIRDAGATLQG